MTGARLNLPSWMRNYIYQFLLRIALQILRSIPLYCGKLPRLSICLVNHRSTMILLRIRTYFARQRTLINGQNWGKLRVKLYRLLRAFPLLLILVQFTIPFTRPLIGNGIYFAFYMMVTLSRPLNRQIRCAQRYMVRKKGRVLGPTLINTFRPNKYVSRPYRHTNGAPQAPNLVPLNTLVTAGLYGRMTQRVQS